MGCSKIYFIIMAALVLGAIISLGGNTMEGFDTVANTAATVAADAAAVDIAAAHNAVELYEGVPSERGPKNCSGGAPLKIDGNCKRFCKGDSRQIATTNPTAKKIHGRVSIPPRCSQGISTTSKWCPNNPTCYEDGPWYKTPCKDSECEPEAAHVPTSGSGTSVPRSGSGTGVPGSGSGDGDVPGSGSGGGDVPGSGSGTGDVPGSGSGGGWDGDRDYPSSSVTKFQGGEHHHYYKGSDMRRWRNEVKPASPHLPTSPNAQQNLVSQMSPLDSTTSSSCQQSVTGAFSDCGPAAANLPCYALFNN